MDNFLPIKVHEEYAKRMSDWNKRQDARIEELETTTKELSRMNLSIEKMATSMELMMKEQQNQGKRLEVIESRDGEMWRKVTGYVVTCIVGAIIGFILNQIGI